MTSVKFLVKFPRKNCVIEKETEERDEYDFVKRKIQKAELF